ALCAVCIDGYHASSQGAACTPCPSASTATGATIGFTILIIAALCVIFYTIWRSDPVFLPKNNPWRVVKVYTLEDRSAVITTAITTAITTTALIPRDVNISDSLSFVATVP